MDAILGEYNDDRTFATFLARWRPLLHERVAAATAEFGAIDGVDGLILAGSLGRGEPWPLSDIDLIPVYRDHAAESARAAVEQIRPRIMERWSGQGWRTGVDIGRLFFLTSEVDRIACDPTVDLFEYLHDDRWYYAIDKAYRGSAVVDPTGRVTQVVEWLTARRFQSGTVAYRLARTSSEIRGNLEIARRSLVSDEIVAAYSALLKAIQWRQIHLMESWGQRDNSLGRFGTHFETEALRHRADAQVAFLDALAALDADSVHARMSEAAGWVRQRRARSWTARQLIEETVTPLQNDRDTLRVSTIYELRVASGPPYATWLAVPSSSELLRRIDMMEAALVAPTTHSRYGEI